MSTPEMPTDPPRISESIPTKPVEGEGEQQTPESFQSMMEQQEGAPTTEKSGGPSPFDAQQVEGAKGPPSFDDLKGQMDITSGELNKTEENLKKGPKFNRSQTYLMKKKLGTVQGNLRYVNEKVGGNPQPYVSKGKNPADRFMDMIQDSQDQINGAQEQMKQMSENGTSSMNPGEMLHMQTKIQKANIELNFVSILVADAASGIKTMFNMQI